MLQVVGEVDQRGPTVHKLALDRVVVGERGPKA
jgi:hypothetical protein